MITRKILTFFSPAAPIPAHGRAVNSLEAFVVGLDPNVYYTILMESDARLTACGWMAQQSKRPIISLSPADDEQPIHIFISAWVQEIFHRFAIWNRSADSWNVALENTFARVKLLHGLCTDCGDCCVILLLFDFEN